MKNFLQKIKNSEIAIGLIFGAVALCIIGVIVGIVIMLTAKAKPVQSVASNPSSVEINLNGNANLSSSKDISSNKNNNTASIASQVNSQNTTIVNSNGNSSTRTNSTVSQVQSTPKVVKPSGTMKKVSIGDRKGFAARNTARALYLSDRYYSDFFDEYYESLLDKYPIKNYGEVSTAWGYGALQSMQTVITKLSKTTKQLNRLKIVNDGLEYYGYQKDAKLWGYVVHRGASPMGATDTGLAYDDNLWIVINFLRSYELTGDKKHLNKAEYLMQFLIREAWFEPLGGFFWDTRHDARHSCSNNPAIKIFVDLYKHTGKKTYLDWAKKVYDFSYNNLKDKTRNIYEDLIGAHFSNGQWYEGSSKNTGFYSYNTGTMISGAAALYGATKDKKYLTEALDCAKGAMDYFGNKNIISGYTEFACTSNIWFNAILMRGYIDLYPYAKQQTAPYLEEFQKSMDYGYEKFGADSTGYMPFDWLRGWDGSDRSMYRDSLDMSANAEMYGMLAYWQKIRND